MRAAKRFLNIPAQGPFKPARDRTVPAGFFPCQHRFRQFSAEPFFEKILQNISFIF